jgi:hypothetical protein
MRLAVAAPILILTSLAAGSSSANDAMVGPAAAVIRPPELPVQLRDMKLPPGVNRKWLQSDCDLIWSIRRALPPDPASAVLVGLPNTRSTVEQIDLGFGLVRHQQKAGGGYFSCHITTVTHHGDLVSMKVSCWGHLEKPQARLVIERALGEGFRRVDSRYAEAYQTDYEFPLANRRARAALDTRLGPLAPVAVPAELASAYARLMSPAEELAVGGRCGEGGTPPPGAEETEALRSARRIDLLRNVLRGPNPEARVYALSALRQLDALDAKDRASVERLTALPIKVRNCFGCTFGSGTLQEALRALK